MKQSTQGFSIIELLIGMFIFAIGLMAIYGLLVSSLRLNDLSKDSIIATNLAREALEIVRHTRDSNYEHMYLWNKLPGESVDNTFKTGTYYTVENNWNEVIPEEDIYKQIADFGQGQEHLLGKMQNYRLYLTPENIYTYNSGTINTPTWFYRYVYVDEVKGENGILNDALKITSKVIWYKNGYHEVQLDTIITDFLRR